MLIPDPNFSIPDPVSRVEKIPDPNFSIPDPVSRVEKIPDPDPHQRIEVFLTQKIVTKLSKIRMIQDVHPGSGFFPGSLLSPDPASGSATVSRGLELNR
jgi:hypothetical protein